MGGAAGHNGAISNLITQTINRDPKDTAQPPKNFSGVAIYTALTKIDQAQYSFRIHMDFRPKGNFWDKTDPLQRTINRDVSFIMSLGLYSNRVR